jgi:glycine cleavage system aminomethyltransferase T
MADGKEVGHVTRTAFSPALQSAIGMGSVRREKSQLNSQLSCGTNVANVITSPLSESQSKS